MKLTSAKLRQAQAKGGRIIYPSAPWKGQLMEYRPRSERDSKPWVLANATSDVFRFSAPELDIDWGPDGEPVKLTDVQRQIVDLFVQRGDWYPGSGWVWSNRSTTIKYLDGLVRKGVLIRTSDQPYNERYALSDLGHRQFNKSQGLPTEDQVKTVLVMMAEQNGEWEPGCGWWYRNEFFTKLCLTLLVRQDLVVRSGERYGLRGGKGFDAARAAGWDDTLIPEEY